MAQLNKINIKAHPNIYEGYSSLQFYSEKPHEFCKLLLQILIRQLVDSCMKVYTVKPAIPNLSNADTSF